MSRRFYVRQYDNMLWFEVIFCMGGLVFFLGVVSFVLVFFLLVIEIQYLLSRCFGGFFFTS